jgi:hypothetical protein
LVSWAPLTVAGGEQSFNLGGVKQRTVMAMLIAHAGEPVSMDAIVEALWGEETPSIARRNTQTYVATLRGQVGDVIDKTSQGGNWWPIDKTSTPLRSKTCSRRRRIPLDFTEPNGAATGSDSPDHLPNATVSRCGCS